MNFKIFTFCTVCVIVLGLHKSLFYFYIVIIVFKDKGKAILMFTTE